MTLVQTVSFTDDGRISFDVGCKTGVGSVAVEPDVLRVSDLRLTGIACGSVVAEITDAAMTVLGAREVSYSIDRGILRLRAGPNELQLEARYEGPPG